MHRECEELGIQGVGLKGPWDYRQIGTQAFDQRA